MIHKIRSYKICFFLLALTIVEGSFAATIGADGLEIGGSDFPLYSATTYLQNPTLALWFQPLVLRPVIGTLHYDPDRVLGELTVMKSRGQKKVALLLWFMPFSGRGISSNEVFGHVIASDSNRLPLQQQNNLVTLLGYIQQLGFEEVQIRFGPQDRADPAAWWIDPDHPDSGTVWNEAQYQQNWNFIYNTKNLVESVLAGSAVRRVYDLGGEMAGVTAGQTAQYVKRLWIDYNCTFGNADTYGFSFAVAPGRVTAYINNLASWGILPLSYAFDIYDQNGSSVYSQLSLIASELAQANQLSKSVLIQESLYNDSSTYNQIVSAKTNLNLNVRSIMQWPIDRTGAAAGTNFSMDYAVDYKNYSPSTSPYEISASQALCTMATASGFGSTTINWNTGSSTVGYVTIAGNLFAASPSGAAVAPWIQPGPYIFDLRLSPASPSLAQTIAYGVRVRGKLATSSPDNQCTVNSVGVGTLTIYWSVPDGGTENISVTANGILMSNNSGPVGSSVAPWITTQGVTFRLYAGSTLLDTLVATGIP